MKKLLPFLLLCCCCSCEPALEETAKTPGFISQPFLVEDDDWSFEGTANLLLVPENRLDPESRIIALHFFHFPAKEKSTLPPVAFLGAGPGEPYSYDVFFDGKRAEAWRYEVEFVNQKRDVILINQRGNSGAPGLPIADFRYRWPNGGADDKPLDLALMNENRKKAYAKYIEAYTAKGIDLRGYDVMHFIGDIEAIRQHYHYDKMALIGNSFATQWALAYIRKYPEQVDRAFFSGIEPLNNNYDDPDGLWAVLEQVNAYALANPEIARDLPPGGIPEVFKTLIKRLEEEPQTVELEEDGEAYSMVVGADDLRYNYLNPMARSYKGELESWPKYLMDMYRGDFRLLASLSRGRKYRSSSLMINPLFNNSLGITQEREALLQSRESARWLGDVADHYTATRDVCPAPKVDESFLEPIPHNIPMIIIHGDMDLSTPYTNATELMPFLENGHLITVKRGSHNAKRALIFSDRDLMNQIYEFMNLDFAVDDFQAFRQTLPSEYELPEFEFLPIGGESLFERYQD